MHHEQLQEEIRQALEDRIDAVVEGLLRPILDRLERKLKMPPQECFSITETADLTGLSIKHIRRAVRRGSLACSNVSEGKGRRTYLITRRDIEM